MPDLEIPKPYVQAAVGSLWALYFLFLARNFNVGRTPRNTENGVEAPK